MQSEPQTSLAALENELEDSLKRGAMNREQAVAAFVSRARVLLQDARGPGYTVVFPAVELVLHRAHYGLNKYGTLGSFTRHKNVFTPRLGWLPTAQITYEVDAAGQPDPLTLRFSA